MALSDLRVDALQRASPRSCPSIRPIVGTGDCSMRVALGELLAEY